MVNSTLEDAVNEFTRPGYTNLLANLQTASDATPYTPHGQQQPQQQPHPSNSSTVSTGGSTQASSPVPAPALTAASVAAAAAAVTNSVRTLSESEQADEIRKMTRGLGISIGDFAALQESATDLLQPPLRDQQQQHPSPTVASQPPPQQQQHRILSAESSEGGGGVGAPSSQPQPGGDTVVPSPIVAPSSSVASTSLQIDAAIESTATTGPRKQIQRRGERAARQIQPLNTIFYPNPLEGPILVPSQEQEFESLEAAQAAAERYAKSVGTVAIVKRTTKDKLGNVVQRDLACERQGFYFGQNKKTASSIKTKRCGCPWMISVGFSKKRGNREGKRGRFTKIVLEHNHEIGELPPDIRPAVTKQPRKDGVITGVAGNSASASSSVETGTAVIARKPHLAAGTDAEMVSATTSIATSNTLTVADLPEGADLSASPYMDHGQVATVGSNPQVSRTAMEILQEEVRILANRTGIHHSPSSIAAYNGSNSSTGMFAAVQPGLQLQSPAPISQPPGSTGDGSAAHHPGPSPTTSALDETSRDSVVTMEDLQTELSKLPVEWMRRDVMHNMMRLVKLAQQTYHGSTAAVAAAAAAVAASGDSDGDGALQGTATEPSTTTGHQTMDQMQRITPAAEQTLAHQLQQHGRPPPTVTWSSAPQTNDTKILSEMLTAVGGGGSNGGSAPSVVSTVPAQISQISRGRTSRDAAAATANNTSRGDERRRGSAATVNHPSTTADMLAGLQESLLPTTLTSAPTVPSLHHPHHHAHHHQHNQHSTASSAASSAIPTTHTTPTSSPASHMVGGTTPSADMAAAMMLHVSSAPTTSSSSSSATSAATATATIPISSTSTDAHAHAAAAAVAAVTAAIHGNHTNGSTVAANGGDASGSGGVAANGSAGRGGNGGGVSNGSVLSFTHVQGVLTNVTPGRDVSGNGGTTAAAEASTDDAASQQDLLRHLTQQSNAFQFMVDGAGGSRGTCGNTDVSEPSGSANGDGQSEDDAGGQDTAPLPSERAHKRMKI